MSTRGVRTFRTARDQSIILVVTVLGIGGMAWQFAQPSRGSWQGESIFAVLAATFGWLGFRAGFRCRLLISDAGLTVINPVRTTHIPFTSLKSISLGTFVLNVATASGKVGVVGIAMSLLDTLQGRDQKILNAILAEVAERRDGAAAADQIRTELRPEIWVFVVLLALFFGEITARRLLA